MSILKRILILTCLIIALGTTTFALPDLIVNNVLPHSIVPGFASQMDIVVQNRGDQTIQGDIYIRMTLNQVNGNNQIIGICKKNINIRNGRQGVLNCEFDIPNGISGEYTLNIMVNIAYQGHFLAESNYNNNGFQFPFNIDINYADLIITELETEEMFANQNFKITKLTVKNIGTSLIDRTVKCRFAFANNNYQMSNFGIGLNLPNFFTVQEYTSFTDTLSSGITIDLGTITLNPQESVPLADVATIEAPENPGDYSFVATLDPNNEIPELDKRNNAFSKQVIIQPQHDLVLEEVIFEGLVDDKNSMHTGEIFTLKVKIKNEGIASIDKNVPVEARWNRYVRADKNVRINLAVGESGIYTLDPYRTTVLRVPESIENNEIRINVNPEGVHHLPELDYENNVKMEPVGVVPDNAPDAEFTMPTSLYYGRTARLDASQSTDDYEIVSYIWTADGKEIGTKKILDYKFYQEDYPNKDVDIELTVTDTIGKTNSETKTISLFEKPWDNEYDPETQTNLDDQTNLDSEPKPETEDTIFGEIILTVPEEVYPEEDFEVTVDADVDSIEILFDSEKYDMHYSPSREEFYYELTAPENEGNYQITFTLEKDDIIEKVRRIIEVEGEEPEITSSGPDGTAKDEEERIYVKTNVDVEMCKYSTDEDDDYTDMKNMKEEDPDRFYRDVELEEGKNYFYVICETKSGKQTDIEKIKITYETEDKTGITTTGTPTGLFGLAMGDFVIGAVVAILLIVGAGIYLFMLKK